MDGNQVAQAMPRHVTTASCSRQFWACTSGMEAGARSVQARAAIHPASKKTRRAIKVFAASFLLNKTPSQ